MLRKNLNHLVLGLVGAFLLGACSIGDSVGGEDVRDPEKNTGKIIEADSEVKSAAAKTAAGLYNESKETRDIIYSGMALSSTAVRVKYTVWFNSFYIPGRGFAYNVTKTEVYAEVSKPKWYSHKMAIVPTINFYNSSNQYAGSVTLKKVTTINRGIYYTSDEPMYFQGPFSSTANAMFIPSNFDPDASLKRVSATVRIGD